MFKATIRIREKVLERLSLGVGHLDPTMNIQRHYPLLMSCFSWAKIMLNF